MKKYFVLILLLIACSDKSKDSFELGKRAYDSGKFIKAKTLFMQVDSVSQWSGQASAYLHKIDSVSALSDTTIPEAPIPEITFNGEYFEEQSLLLDTTQFQLIDQTCALFLVTPDERRRQKEKFVAMQDSIQEASRSNDSERNSSDEEQEDEEAGGDGEGSDDGMWYQYKYEEQFETLKELGIPAVRVLNKRYVQFIDKDKKVWALVDKEGAFFDDGMVLFHVDKKPMRLNLTDWSSDEIRKYFSSDVVVK